LKKHDICNYPTGSTAPSRRPYRDCTSKWRVPAFPLARLACDSCMHRPLFSNCRASTRDVKPHLATSFQYICSFKNESVQYTIRICPLYEIDSDLGSQPISVMLGRRPQGAALWSQATKLQCESTPAGPQKKHNIGRGTSLFQWHLCLFS
jgi:hypothetical protein